MKIKVELTKKQILYLLSYLENIGLEPTNYNPRIETILTKKLRKALL